MKPKYHIRINGYDIRNFNYSEYIRLKKEDYNSDNTSFEYCVTSEDHYMIDSWGWNSFDNLIIASDSSTMCTLELDITDEISNGTPYSDIKQRIDLIVDIGNAVMETLNKRK